MKRIKDFFSTSTKAATITVCIIVVIAVYGIRVVFAAGDADTKKQSDSNGFQQEVIHTSEPQKVETITLEEAKRKALEDAGLQEGNVTFTKEGQDYENNIPVYDLEFYTDETEYEYEIYVETGAIYSKSKETRVQNSIQNSTGENSKNSAPKSKVTASPSSKTGNSSFNQDESNASYIGIDSAKSIAVTHAQLKEADVVFSKVKLDKDDGVMVYEIEFVKDGREYEYTLEAVTGEIIEYDVERLDYD